jgi:hypothetical protein
MAQRFCPIARVSTKSANLYSKNAAEFRIFYIKIPYPAGSQKTTSVDTLPTAWQKKIIYKEHLGNNLSLQGV